MIPQRPPIDARAAKRRLRFYAMALPVSTLIGSRCGLLALVWLAFPESVEHIPDLGKGGAAMIAVWWFFWLCQTYRRLPAVIDGIIAHGLALKPSRGVGVDQRLGP